MKTELQQSFLKLILGPDVPNHESLLDLSTILKVTMLYYLCYVGSEFSLFLSKWSLSKRLNIGL